MNSQCSIILLAVINCLAMDLQGHEFIYPIALSKNLDQPILFLMHQTSAQQIELLGWNVATQQLFPLLHSLFTPAMVRMLPDGSGFSFIDNGRIRIKKFNKRSPKTLDIYDPLFKISAFEWMNEHIAYVSAKKRNRYGIFQLDNEGNVTTLQYSRTADCLYPQKVGSLLYYIERCAITLDQVRYEIVCCAYPESAPDSSYSFNNTDNFHERVKSLLDNYQNENELTCGNDSYLVLPFGNRPIMHLHMISPQEGLVIEYPESVDSDDILIPFTMHHCVHYTDGWASNPLFTFNLPRSLIGSTCEDRLYESIAPLIPHYHNERIYFVTAPDDGTSLALCSYDMRSGAMEQYTECMQDCFVFSPLALDQRIYYGGNMPDLCCRHFKDMIMIRDSDFSLPWIMR